MTVTLTDIPYTISDRELTYGELGSSAVRDAVLTRLQYDPYEISLAFPGGTMAIRVDGEVPRWLETTASVLKELLWLEPNWDSYGALPVDVHEALAVLELLGRIMQHDGPAPQLVPTNRGGIQIEWHCSGIDIEIESLAPKRFLVSYEDSNLSDEAEWEQDLGSDWARLSDVLDRLS